MITRIIDDGYDDEFHDDDSDYHDDNDNYNDDDKDYLRWKV